MKNFVLINLLLLFLVVSPASAGSYFSARGNNSVGLKQYTTNVRGLGLGGAGLASLDSLGLNNYVFAQWRHVKNTRASFSLFYDYTDAEVGSNNFVTSTANFAGVNFAIPFKDSGWSFGVSLQPYTNMDFQSTEIVALPDSAGNLRQVAIRDGNISRAVAMLGWAPTPKIGFAAHFSYYFGTIEDRYRYQFNAASDFASYSHEVQYQVSSGPGFGFSFDSRPFKKLGLAGFVEFEPSLLIDRVYDSPNLNIDIQKGIFDSFPLYYGIGSNYSLPSRWNISLDYAYQQWSDAVSGDSQDFEDWYQISAGLERSGSKKRSAAFLAELDYRFGVSSRQLGYRVNNASVKENSLHVGVGIPFNRNNYRLDAAVVGGQRGNLTDNGASEMFLRFELSATLGELWFQRIR